MTDRAEELRAALEPALQETADLPALFRVAQDRLPRVLGLEAGCLWVRDPVRRCFLGPAEFGLDPSGALAFRDELPLKAPRQPVWVPDRTLGPEKPVAALFDPRARAYLLLPVVEQDHLLGILAFASTQPRPAENDATLDLAGEIGRRLAVAIRRAEVQLRLQEDFKLHHALLDLVKQLGNELRPEAFYQRVFRILEKLMPADAVFIVTRRPDGQFDAVLETDLDDRDHRIFFPAPRLMETDASSIIRRLDRDRYELILRRPEDLRLPPEGMPGWSPVGNTARRSASLLYVPIWSGDAYAGAISVQSYRLDAYRHADAERLIVIADYLGLAFRLQR